MLGYRSCVGVGAEQSQLILADPPANLSYCVNIPGHVSFQYTFCVPENERVYSFILKHVSVYASIYIYICISLMLHFYYKEF